MPVVRQLLAELTANFRRRLAVIASLVVAINLLAWLWALAVFRHNPTLLGIAVMTYGLGLRHAVDADHIAAIDNVTRKLLHAGDRPVSVGFWFAIGHSSMVMLVATAVIVTAGLLGRFDSLRHFGAVVSTSVSAAFLFAIAATNIAVFVSTYRTYRHVRAGGAYVEDDLNLLLNGRGRLSRLLRPLFRLVTRSWHMLPLGFVFGLGFDTATEVAMFSVSATQAANGASLMAVLVLPVLFAAGMSLVDTADGAMMLGVYEWAFVRPIRKLHYNMTITLVSAVVALTVGGIEALGLVGERMGQHGPAWEFIGALYQNWNGLGFAVIALFLTGWLASYAAYRRHNLREIEGREANSP